MRRHVTCSGSLSRARAFSAGTRRASALVMLVHDAAIDEYMSQVLLTTMPGINLLGAVIVNADCIDSAAMQTAWQVMSYIDRTDIPMGLSSARGWNPFPCSTAAIACVSRRSIA